MPAPSASRQKVLATATALIAALAAGGLAAVVGTLLHAHLAYAGDTPVPWGAVAALVFAGSVFTAAAVYAERVWAAAAAGITAYTLVAWVSMDERNRMIVSWANRELLPGPSLAGALWLYGIVAATVVALLVSARTLRSR